MYVFKICGTLVTFLRNLLEFAEPTLGNLDIKRIRVLYVIALLIVFFKVATIAVYIWRLNI